MLFVATKHRATFGEVNILVPISWGKPESWLPEEQKNTHVFENNGGFPSFLDANVVLNQTASDMEEKPFVLQDDGCGKTGLRINMPVNFLLSSQDMHTKSIEFIYYWAQYRYGVFSEGGFQFDSQFPPYYSVPGTKKVQVTECTNVPIAYAFTAISTGVLCEPRTDNQTGKPTAKECKQSPIINEMLNSSVMFQQALPHAFQFCEGDQSSNMAHNPNTPSKHNVLCSQEATWPIILRSPDFAFGKNPPVRDEPKKVTFRFVQESRFRVVFAIDVSSNMLKNERYDLAKNAITKFILKDLPPGIGIGMVFFAEDIKSVKEITDLKAVWSNEMYFQKSKFYDALNSSLDKICLECGIDLSLQMLRNNTNGEQNGMVVLVLSHGRLTSSQNFSNLQTLKNDAKLAGIRVSALLFSEGATENYEPLETLTSASGGVLIEVPEERTLKTLTDLYLSFHRILSGITSADEHILFVGELPAAEKNFTINFNVDDSTTKILTVLITGPKYYAEEPRLVKVKTVLLPPSGKKQLPKPNYHIQAWSYEFELAETGKYTFKSEWKPKSSMSSRQYFIFVSGRSAANPIHFRIWANHHTPKVTKPLKLFAEVKYGNLPIINVKVTATIRGPDGAVISTFQLLDNGLGDPDITKNDGIYTRYCDISQFALDRYYAVSIDAFDDNSKILYVSNDACCGSFVPFRSKKAIGPFNRTSGLLTFRLSGSQKSINDLIKPNRILDLRVYKILQKQRTVLLHWTAAGHKFDHGAASSYRLKLFEDRISARRRFEDAGLTMEYDTDIIIYTPSKDYGKMMEYTVQWSKTLRPGFYYFAMKALMDSSSSSDISNVVEIFLENKLFNDSISCDTSLEKGAATNLSEQLSIVIICLVSSPMAKCVFGF